MPDLSQARDSVLKCLLQTIESGGIIHNFSPSLCLDHLYVCVYKYLCIHIYLFNNIFNTVTYTTHHH